MKLGPKLNRKMLWVYVLAILFAGSLQAEDFNGNSQRTLIIPQENRCPSSCNSRDDSPTTKAMFYSIEQGTPCRSSPSNLESSSAFLIGIAADDPSSSSQVWTTPRMASTTLRLATGQRRAYNYCMWTQPKSAMRSKSRAVKRHRGKQIIYRYNGDPKHDETVSDMLGSMPFCQVGEIVKKNGKEWRVNVVQDDFNMAFSRTAIPIHRVFLTDNF
jgi:hypothetical protein